MFDHWLCHSILPCRLLWLKDTLKTGFYCRNPAGLCVNIFIMPQSCPYHKVFQVLIFIFMCGLWCATAVCMYFSVCFLSAEFPMPKTELVQKFHVLYLGMTSVSRPIGKSECWNSYMHQNTWYILKWFVSHTVSLFHFVFRYGHHKWGHWQPPVLHRQRGLDPCHTEYCWHHTGCHQRKGKGPFVVYLKNYMTRKLVIS